MPIPNYYPEFFNAQSFDEAKFIVLCSNEQDYNYRQKTETEWIRDQLISTRSINDGIDNRQELAKWFNPLILGKLPRAITVESIFGGSWWGFLEKK